MCEYCKNVATGNDYNPMLRTSIDFGFLGNFEIDVFLSNKGLELNCCADSAGDKYIERKAHINYCPMCGEKIG